MRLTFINTLVELAKNDQRIMLLTGDLGFMALEPFIDNFPDRYINVGVAEQNMVGVATGLAEAGFIPFVYSIVTFATLRPYEFIRNGPIHHQLPVRIIGVGGGFEYGPAGSSHHGTEDIAIMRCQPGISIFAPADYKQTKSVLEKTWELPGPIYYRLGKNEKDFVEKLEGKFDISKIQLISTGNDVLIITMGGISVQAAQASDMLMQGGISSTVAIVASVAPPPISDLISVLSKHTLVICVEAHSINGGLGSLVAEIIAENNFNCKLLRLGMKELNNGVTGSQAYLENKYGISADSLRISIKNFFQSNK